MTYRNIKRLRAALFIALAAIALWGIYVTTPEECFGDGPLPRYCVEG